MENILHNIIINNQTNQEYSELYKNKSPFLGNFKFISTSVGIYQNWSANYFNIE